MRTGLAVLALLLPTLAACPVGHTAGGFRPARDPAGAQVRIAYGEGQDLTGELIAVRDSAVILRRDSTFYLVPVDSVSELRAIASGAGASFGRDGWSDQTHERLRLLSRFPQGLTDDLLRQLLAAYGQTSLRTLPP